ncbi:MAG: EamA family transporter [Acidobacteria bacterium]|nr:EamA family transporter [Acidobacteriota bacterium]
MPYLIAVSFIWGFSFVIIKGWLVSLDPGFVSLARLLLSLLVFAPFMRLRGIRAGDGLRLGLIGGVQFGVMYVAYIAAYPYLPAHTIVLMTTTTPLFVTVFNGVFRGKLNTTFMLAALLAVAGGAVIQYPVQPLSVSLFGIGLIQASNAAFAFGQIAYKRWMASRPGLRDKNVFGFMYAGAVVVAGLFSLAATDYGRLAVSPGQWLFLLYLGIVASGICFFLWNLGARKVGDGSLAVMNNLKIPAGVVLSLLILGEATDYVRLVAGCILFASALWVNRKMASKGSP